MSSGVPRVLVVDDNPDILGLVAFRLRKAGHDVTAVGSGLDALAAAVGDRPPDLAVLDVSMPGMDGLELLGRLRAHAGLDGLPAIFLSARVQPHDIAAGRALGAAYLTKPFVGTALLNAVEAALRGTPGPAAA